jgi:hypothetical protein
MAMKRLAVTALAKKAGFMGVSQKTAQQRFFLELIKPDASR